MVAYRTLMDGGSFADDDGRQDDALSSETGDAKFC